MKSKPPLLPKRTRLLLQRVLVCAACVLLLCGSFLAVPYIASAIPKDLSYYLNGEQPPALLRPLAAGLFDMPAPEVSEPAIEPPTESDEPTVMPPPENALPVLAENFCWYENAQDAALYLINRTSYRVDPNDFAERTYPIRTRWTDVTSEPVVLILHTHGTESYLPERTDYYLPEEQFRSEQEEETVVAVGEAIAQTLRAYGIPVLHDKTMYDKDDFNHAYTASKAAALQALEAHPSIRYILDVHRDSIFASDDTCRKTLAPAETEPTAQIMLVVGTDDSGAAHPNWRQNLTVATHLQETLGRMYPTLARPINLRTGPFNQMLLPGSLLLEVGSCGNSIDEAKRAGVLFANAFADLLQRHT